MTPQWLKQYKAYSVPLACAFLLSIFWIVRYGTYIIEGDSSNMALFADAIRSEGVLVPSQSAYSNGYGYPTILAFMSTISGLSIASIQVYISLGLVALALIACICYHQILGTARMAAFATLILLIQPDFIFYVLRGSHEKITWSFALLLLFFLVQSYKHVEDIKSLTLYVVLFYFVLWGMISINVFFASSYIGALAVSFIVSRIGLLRLKKAISLGESYFFQRFMYVGIIGFGLIFMFVTALYFPARKFFETLGGFVKRASVLALGAQQVTDTTYLDTINTWVSTPIYLVLTGLQWGFVIMSFLAWLYLGHIVLKKGLLALDRPQRLLWLIYSGFAAQLALGILANDAQNLGNLQVRLFTPFTIITSAMDVILLKIIITVLRRRFGRIVYVAGCVAIAGALCTAILKATNEPTFSNIWLFNTPDYRNASAWVDTNVHGTWAWLDTISRQRFVLQNEKGYAWQPSNYYTIRNIPNRLRYIVIADQAYFLTQRAGVALPMVIGYDRVYDNGRSRVYHRPAQSPFEK